MDNSEVYVVWTMNRNISAVFILDHVPLDQFKEQALEELPAKAEWVHGKPVHYVPRNEPEWVQMRFFKDDNGDRCSWRTLDKPFKSGSVRWHPATLMQVRRGKEQS